MHIGRRYKLPPPQALPPRKIEPIKRPTEPAEEEPVAEPAS